MLCQMIYFKLFSFTFLSLKYEIMFLPTMNFVSLFVHYDILSLQYLNASSALLSKYELGRLHQSTLQGNEALSEFSYIFWWHSTSFSVITQSVTNNTNTNSNTVSKTNSKTLQLRHQHTVQTVQIGINRKYTLFKVGMCAIEFLCTNIKD